MCNVIFDFSLTNNLIYENLQYKENREFYGNTFNLLFVFCQTIRMAGIRRLKDRFKIKIC